MEALTACGFFPATQTARSVERFGNGHINETYLVNTDTGDYILQKVNQNVFKKPTEVMENILLVTEHIAKKAAAMGKDPLRATLHLNPSEDGLPYHIDTNGNLWRVFDFVKDSKAVEMPKSNEEFASAGKAFGEFAKLLADCPAEKLYEVIPKFHDTQKRYRDLLAAIEADPLGRVAEVENEIAFYKARADYYGKLTRANAEGRLPLRVTHNDTKINNILFDAEGGEALCVIDLDTVMPGFTVTDFGDAIRFGASTAAEDEPDLSKVHLSLEKYKAYADAYLAGAGDGLVPAEREMLRDGALMMMLECGMRFLTDYIQGDTYFRIHREKHNLDRTRTQIRLAEETEAAWEQLLQTKHYKVGELQ